MQTIHVIDSHTAGEPTRVVMSGFPDLGNGSLAQRREAFRATYDHWRSAIACEPRGSDTMVGALLQPPTDPRCCAAVIFFNNVGYLGMCGHGTIGLTRTLAHVGSIQPGEHLIETPVGVVGVTLHDDGRVSIDNVESYRYRADAEVEVPGYGTITGDIAWGGNWFFITPQTPRALDIGHRNELSSYTIAIQQALEAAGIRGEDGGVIDHVEISGDAPDGSGARNFVMCPGGAYDRSPCGTGTSAKIACLAADAELAEGERWVQQGILGSAFEGSYRNGGRGVMPTITGQAWITGTSQILIEDSDPLAWGIGGTRP
ncbi:proline racemase family protein [Stenotrophomonas sp. SY1]|jgi:4-hydroxyproline epimerase|uniref:proline racemase family protein n=1 Tax=Stenotrophomonas sp. SY1 TaxID=477235 RepID=UPI001E58EA65|nr:proline racemase family protein [Stenotrophomonas sp. SY1]MCD9085238.1 proline racemase family protein [Stenotrophomonas sp. SY1]